MSRLNLPRRALAIIILAVLVLNGCAPQPERLTPSGRNSSFTFDTSRPFAAYLAHCREMILASRTDLNGPERETILAANLPFELLPDPVAYPVAADGRHRKGIILIHGLSNSPYLMRALGEHFRGRGFLVRTILLPGHGTRPGDLSRVTEAAWRQALEYAGQETGRRVETLYLGGFSTGGALAVNYALEHPGTVKALALFSPCLRVKNPAARWAGLVSLVRPWLEISADQDYAKYESFPVNAAAQLYRLTERIDQAAQRHPERLGLPVFLALSGEDETVDSAFSLDFFQQRFSNPASRLLLFSGAPTQPRFADPRLMVVTSYLPSRKILSLSHLALTIPANDPHYGSQGDYRSCLHYPADSSEFADCRAGRAVWLGEKTPANLKRGLLQRLSWNPRFTAQLNELDHFLDTLEPPPPVAVNAAGQASKAGAAAGRCFCSAGL